MRQKDSSSYRHPQARRIQGAILILAAVCAVLVAAWVVIGRQVMLLVPEYRSDLEALIEQRLQTPLEIGALHGYMEGATPVFVLEDVQLPAGEGVTPMRVGRVELSVDVLPSLLGRTLRPRQLVIRGIHIHLMKDSEGRVHFKGLEGLGSAGQRSGSSLDALLDFIYRQKRLVIEDASGMLELADLPTVEISALSVAVVSAGGKHRLALQARAADRPATLDVRLEMDGDAYRLEEVNAEAYLRLRAAGLDSWVDAVWPWPLHTQAVDGTVSAWASVRGGHLARATVDADLERMSLAGEPLRRPLNLQGIHLLAELQSADRGYAVNLAELSFAYGSRGIRLGPMGVTWNGARGDALRWHAGARDLELSPLRALLLELPLRHDERRAGLLGKLERMKPAGTLTALSLQGGHEGLAQASVRFADLRMQAEGKLPGLAGVSGWAAGNMSEGLAFLDTPLFSLDLPLMFRAPMTMAASGPLRWRHAGSVTLIDSGWLQARNEDATGRAVASLRIHPGHIPYLSLMATLADGKASAAPTYIPLKRLPDTVALWLSEAFRDGVVDRGTLLYEGPVRIDPERQQDRTLQIALAARDLDLHYRTGWPLAEDLSAELMIDGRAIRGRHVSGLIMGTHLDEATVDIPSYGEEKGPELIVHSRVRGPAQNLQTLFQQTPLREVLPAELADWRVNAGLLQGHLLLHLPLRQGAGELAVLARGQMDGAHLANPGRRLSIEQMSGAVAFSLAEGLQIPAFQARLWGEPVSGQVTSERGATRIAFTGGVSVQALRDWLQAGWASPAGGTLEYQAELDLIEGSAPALSVQADMREVVVNLPAPLGKSAGTAGSASLRLVARPDGPVVTFHYEDQVSGRLWLDDNGLERGSLVIGKGAIARPDEKGLWISGEVPELAVAPWIDFFTGNEFEAPAEPGAQPVRELALQVGRLNLFGIPVDKVRLTARAVASGWRFAADSTQLTGSVHLPEGYETRGEKPLRIHVRHLRLNTQAAGDDPEDILDPGAMPVADVVLDNVMLDGDSYGHWRFAMRPSPQGVSINELTGSIRGANVQGRIAWRDVDGSPQSHFVGSVESGDVAQMLRLWDFEPLLESDSLRSLADVRWPGSPLDIDYLALQGTASLEIGESRFPKTDSRTSALRVLGVFNVGTVSRRLRLDFTDLYRKGLSCDSIGGDFRFEGPLVTTENLVIKSPSAEFRVRGEIDLAERMLNHHMEVTLPVSSNLYVGCLAGPTACAGIFVVERLWGNRLEKMTTLGYRVTGSWDNPKVEEVQGMFERKK